MKVDNVDEKILKVCIAWQSEAPFFAEFLLRFNYEETESIPTAAVSIYKNKLYLLYNKEFINTLSNSELKGVLVHEIMHILHRFHARLGDRDIKIFNVAQDACINETVVSTTVGNTRLTLPDGCVRMSHIHQMKYKGEAITEPVYDFLFSNAQKVICSGPGGGDDDDSQGKGSGEEVNGKTVLKTVDDHSQHDALSDMDEEALDEIIKSAKTKSWGSISGNIIGEIEDLLKSKEIPWHQKLAYLLSRYINDPGNIYENNWSRRNRRGLPLPGVKKLSRKIIVTVDTSGSIGDDDIQRFFFHIEKIIRDYSNLVLIQWDTQVTSSEIYKKGGWRKIKIHGRGGTDPQLLYDHIYEKYKSSIAVVNFTDGYFSWSFDHHNIPTIWAMTTDEIPKFGKYVHVERE